MLELYVKRARKEGVGLWADASNERSRDLCLYFGLEVVDVVTTFVGSKGRDGLPKVGGEGVRTWLMCLKPKKS